MTTKTETVAAQAVEIQDLKDRLAKLEAAMIKSASYKDIIAAVETAVKSSNIDGEIQKRLRTFAASYVSPYDVREQICGVVHTMVTETHTPAIVQMVADRVVMREDFQERVLAYMGDAGLKNFDITAIVQAAVDLRLEHFLSQDILPSIVVNGIAAAEGNLTNRLIRNGAFVKAVTDAMKTHISAQVFTLRPI